MTVTASERTDARDKLRVTAMDISTIRLTKSEINRTIAGAKVALNGLPCFSGSAGNLYPASKPAANPLARFRQLAKAVMGHNVRTKSRRQDFS